MPDETPSPESAVNALMAAMFAHAITGPGRSPVEPRAEIRQGAASMFECYTAWTEAGFTSAQALEMLALMITRGASGK